MAFSLGGALSKYVFGSQAPGAPGSNIGTGAPDPSRLVQNPDGTSTDPVDGQIYVNTPDKGLVAQGTTDSTRQAQGNLNKAAGYAAQVPGYDAREAGAYAGEASTADYLNTIALGGGPSVAGAQLATGEDAAAKQQLAQAAGASGNNAALARMAAMGNTGQAQANTNQQQATARIGEQTNAINSLAGVQQNMQNQSESMGGQKLSAADTLNSLAMQGEAGHEGQNVDINKTNANNNLTAGTLGAKAAGAALGF
jgi:hypothetical protein